MSANLPRTVVEFVSGGDGPAHVMSEVRINGTPVLVESGGVDITHGFNEPTVVILRLLATEVHFIGGGPK